MTFVDELKPALGAIRAIPGTLGLRPYTVQVVVRSGVGSYGLNGVDIDETVSITEAGGQPPKVRFLSPKELAIGELAGGSVDVGPITPDHTGGGTAIALLTGSALEHKQIKHFKLTGPEFPDGRLFRLMNVRSDRALQYMLTLSPVSPA
jgi:hypothetical protein